MSSTRHAQPGSPLRQERFCSSPEFERGLMANLVAKRAAVLDRQEDRALVYFLQRLSHEEGGLRKVAEEIVNRWPERLSTPAMRRIGIEQGGVCTADQVKEIREELDLLTRSEEERLLDMGGFTDWKSYRALFPLRGEIDPLDERYSSFSSAAEHPGIEGLPSLEEFRMNEARKKAASHPDCYPASVFLELCRQESKSLPAFLQQFCLDPSLNPETSSPWYFPGLIGTLREYMAQWIEDRRSKLVVTELGRQVYETLDYALEGRCMVLIDGLARTGKTFAANAWCDLHPGRARYVQVPSTTDDIGFFRAIAKALGVSINLNSKSQQLRDRVEDVLQQGHLLLVLDEGHFLWPQGNYREALPGRLNWVMTALVNHGVSIAIIATPQFLRSQKRVEQKTTWTSEQFTGRIGHYQKLPPSLSRDDLESVARAALPEGGAKAIETLVVYAQGTAKYLAGIEAVVRRARFLARKEDREEVAFADIKKAIQESVIPSDSALAQALAEPVKPGRKAPCNTVAMPLQGPIRPAATPATGIRRAAKPDFADHLSAPLPQDYPGRKPDEAELVEA